ncbi:MAG: peptidylprolyl isomerase [Gammaproteobacteria bacterium]
MKRYACKILVVAAALCLPGYGMGADAAGGVAQQDTELFASVGTSSITVEEYNQAVQQASRSKFYHGTPAEGAMDQLRHDVAREVITRELLLQEAARRGLTADEAAITKSIAEFDQRYADSPRWKEQRDVMIESLSQHYREQDLLQQLESEYRKVAPPDQVQLQEFYRTHQDKFTEPAQHRLSLILLRVDPSSPKELLDAAMQEASHLVAQLADGADFAELARLHSADNTSRQGGDMGYLHAGMLSPVAEEAIAGLETGEVSAPLRLLEGVAILRLEDRKQAQLRKFEEVSARARDLWLREQSQLAWQRLQDELWEKTPISVHDALLTLNLRK